MRSRQAVNRIRERCGVGEVNSAATVTVTHVQVQLGTMGYVRTATVHECLVGVGVWSCHARKNVLAGQRVCLFSDEGNARLHVSLDKDNCKDEAWRVEKDASRSGAGTGEHEVNNPRK